MTDLKVITYASQDCRARHEHFCQALLWRINSAILSFNMHLMPSVMGHFAAGQLEAATSSRFLLTVPMTTADESPVPAARLLHGAVADIHVRTRQALAVAGERQKHLLMVADVNLSCKIGRRTPLVKESR